MTRLVPVERSRQRAAMLPDTALEHSECYADWIRPQGICAGKAERRQPPKAVLHSVVLKQVGSGTTHPFRFRRRRYLARNGTSESRKGFWAPDRGQTGGDESGISA